MREIELPFTTLLGDHGGNGSSRVIAQLIPIRACAAQAPSRYRGPGESGSRPASGRTPGCAGPPMQSGPVGPPCVGVPSAGQADGSAGRASDRGRLPSDALQKR
jgi:hypothetical protein